MRNYTNLSNQDTVEFKTGDLIRRALDQGFDELSRVLHNSSSDLSNTKSEFYRILMIHKENIYSYFIDPELFKINQDSLYNYIYDSKYHFSEEEQLFYEFLIGLCRFEFCLEMVIRFCEHAIKNFDLKPELPESEAVTVCNCSFCTHEAKFWKPLHDKSLEVIKRMSHLATLTDTFNLISFWDMAESFFQYHQSYQTLSQFLVSMQTIPKNPRMLGIAQALHWGGFGGSGAYLKPFMQMDPLMPHRIGYHGKETGDLTSVYR